MAVSNQQNGHPGQPPYGQQPQQPPYGPPQQYGQPQYGPQYGGYPPPPRRSSKAGVIVLSIVGALVLVAGGLFAVISFTGGSDDSAGDSTRPAAPQPSNDAPTLPTDSPTTGTSPDAPPSSPAVPPARTVCNGCFPGITVSGLVGTLKSKGYVCTEDRVLGIECTKGKLEVGIDRDYTQKNFVESVDVGGRAGGAGEFPQGPGLAFATLKAGLPGVLPLVIKDAAVRQQITSFTAQHAGQADGGPATVKDARFGGYRVSIHGVSGATIRKNGRSASSFSTSVNIYGPSDY